MDYQTRNLGPSVRICHLNIESISYSKSQYLSKLLKQDNIDLVAIQETHCNTEEQLNQRGKIPGYDPLGATYHHIYGVATSMKSNIDNATLVSTSSNNDIHTDVVQIGSITVFNIYIPPGWPLNSEELYQTFSDTGDQEVADELLHSLDDARKQKRMEVVESMNFQASSRQAWALLRKLGSGAPMDNKEESKQMP
ncbi:hypothetical protein AAG570_007412 [Ranatra chinensis]|uniref:Endonuclease/exonuclease/phosphatase domain-containing protein n=1 Tax=Ranatra chinensis TaxID=642074 RepID=A0ABD0XVS2_9HEMI